MSDNLEAKLSKGIRLQKCIAMDGDYGSGGSHVAAPGAKSTGDAPPARMTGGTGY